MHFEGLTCCTLKSEFIRIFELKLNEVAKLRSYIILIKSLFIQSVLAVLPKNEKWTETKKLRIIFLVIKYNRWSAQWLGIVGRYKKVWWNKINCFWNWNSSCASFLAVSNERWMRLAISPNKLSFETKT